MSQSEAKIDAQASPLLRSNQNSIAYLTLNRPSQFNALSEELLQALQEELDCVANEPEVRVVVLAGAGRAFCAGHDLKQMRAHPEKAYYQTLFQRCSQLMLTIQRIPQPVIARVHGVATAAGCQLVAACDLAVASEEARFAVSGINVGLFCSTPAVALSRNVSRKQAAEMLFTGGFIDARRAAELGLINRAVPGESLDAEIAQLTAAICGKSPLAVRLGKEMFYRQAELGVEDAYRLAGDVMACNMMTEDAAEGIDAFMGRRPAQWKGR